MIHRKSRPGTAKKSGWGSLGLAPVLGTGPLPRASALQPFMPRAEDFALRWWAKGPQRFHTMRSPPPEAVLCLQSGTLGVVLDTKSVRLLHAGRFPKPQD